MPSRSPGLDDGPPPVEAPDADLDRRGGSSPSSMASSLPMVLQTTDGGPSLKWAGAVLSMRNHSRTAGVLARTCRSVPTSGTPVSRGAGGTSTPG